MARNRNKTVKQQERAHDASKRCCFCHSDNLNRRAKVRDGHLVCGSCRDKHGL
jgi:formylmethanofuran dehydrogenase subunit E